MAAPSPTLCVVQSPRRRQWLATGGQPSERADARYCYYENNHHEQQLRYGKSSETALSPASSAVVRVLCPSLLPVSRSRQSNSGWSAKTKKTHCWLAKTLGLTQIEWPPFDFIPIRGDGATQPPPPLERADKRNAINGSQQTRCCWTLGGSRDCCGVWRAQGSAAWARQAIKSVTGRPVKSGRLALSWSLGRELRNNALQSENRSAANRNTQPPRPALSTALTSAHWPIQSETAYEPEWALNSAGHWHARCQLQAPNPFLILHPPSSFVRS